MFPHRPVSSALSRADQFVDLAMLFQPGRVTPLGMFADVSDELHGLGFVARLAGIVRRNDHLDFDGHDETTTPDQPGCLDPIARDSHPSPSIEEVNSHQLRNPGLSEQRPDCLELDTVGQGLAGFHGRVGRGVRPLDDEDAIFQPRDRLPFEDAAFVDTLRGVLADDIPLLIDEFANILESLAHECRVPNRLIRLTSRWGIVAQVRGFGNRGRRG